MAPNTLGVEMLVRIAVAFLPPKAAPQIRPASVK